MKVILFLFFPAFSFSQVIYKGDVINIKTKEKVHFATVGLIKANTGINADEDGKFTLTTKIIPHDTLIISSIGYETLKTPVDILPLNMQFELVEKSAALKEVVVKNNYLYTTLNEFSSCGDNAYTTTGFIYQAAQHFQSPVENATLSEIEICKTDDKALFRVRIYGIDTLTMKPASDLADTIIEISSRKKHVHIDLEKYRIQIPGKDFFIAIEWLKIPYNEYKLKLRTQGILIQYEPFISFSKLTTNNIPNNIETWYLDYTGTWLKGSIFPRTLLVSAKVKY